MPVFLIDIIAINFSALYKIHTHFIDFLFWLNIGRYNNNYPKFKLILHLNKLKK